MTKDEIYKRIRDPRLWNTDFFKSVSAQPQKTYKALYGIVKRELLEHLDAFENGSTAAAVETNLEKVKKQSESFLIPTAESIPSKSVEWLCV